MGADGDSLTFSGAVEASDIQLGDGNDTAQFENFDGTVVGGSGNDSINFNRSVEKATVKGGTGNDTITFDTTLDSSYVWGNSDDDSITVTGATTGSTIYGGKQQDIITVAAATNTKLRGDKGNDTITVSGALDNVVIQGNADNDQINVSSATATNSTVFGGKGVDDINITGAAAMLIRGDDGADDIDITANAAYTVSGGEGADSIDSNSTVAGQYFGGNGNDTMTVNGVVAIAGTQNYVSGDVGDDVITGANDADSIDGGTGADTITGAGGADTIYGKAGADSIDVSGGTAGKLNVLGGSDDDTILIAAAGLDSDDTIKGETGTDVLSFTASSGNIADAQFKNVATVETLLFSGAQLARTYTLASNAQSAGITKVDLTGGTGGTTQTVNASGYTSAVSITIEGGATNGSIFTGGAGADSLTLAASGGIASTLTGGAGIDTFTIANTGTTAVTDLGTGGADVFDIAATSGVVTFTVAANYTASATSKNNGAVNHGLVDASGFDVNLGAINTGAFGYVITGTAAAATLQGSDLADSITGGAAVDSIVGNAGADTLNAAGGNDTVSAGAGDDTIVSTNATSTALDSIDGGTGNDTIEVRQAGAVYAGTFDMDRISNVLNFTTTGNGTNDATLTFSPIAETTAQTVTINAASFTAGDLVIAGDSNVNDANGTGSATTTFNITGGDVADTIRGGLGADTITAGSGADIITGGGGADTLNFGIGVDTAIMTTAITADTVTAFKANGADLISPDISAFNLAGGAGTGVTSLSGGLSAVATAAASVFLDVNTATANDTTLTAATLVNLTTPGGFADLAAVETALTGANGIATGGTGLTLGDTILFQYENSTTSTFKLGVIETDIAVAANTSIAAADISVREFADIGAAAAAAADVVFVA